MHIFILNSKTMFAPLTADESAAPFTAKLMVTSVCPFANRDSGHDTSGTMLP